MWTAKNPKGDISVYVIMATPYRQTLSPVMVRYTRGYTCVCDDGYTLKADNVTCHGKIYKGVYMYM